jgi:hypothetical protein
MLVLDQNMQLLAAKDSTFLVSRRTFLMPRRTSRAASLLARKTAPHGLLALTGLGRFSQHQEREFVSSLSCGSSFFLLPPGEKVASLLDG